MLDLFVSEEDPSKPISRKGKARSVGNRREKRDLYFITQGPGISCKRNPQNVNGIRKTQVGFAKSIRNPLTIAESAYTCGIRNI